MASDTRKTSERSIGADVLEFAREHDIEAQFFELLELAERLLGKDRLCEVAVEEDAEIDEYRFIVIRFDTTGLSGDELYEADCRWGDGVGRYPIPTWNLFYLSFTGRA